MNFTIKTTFPIDGHTVIELTDIPEVSLGQYVDIDNQKVKVVGIPMVPAGKVAIEIDKRLESAKILTV